MNVLVDSDILIEVLRGRDQEIVDRWKESEFVFPCRVVQPVSVCELWHGARGGEEAALETLFSALLCVPADVTIGRLAGTICDDTRRAILWK